MGFKLQYFKVMRPITSSGKDLGNSSYWLRRKYDGTRTIILKEGNYVKLIGRSWINDYASNHPKIIDEVRRLLFDGILDCELTFFDKNGKDSFLTALASEKKRQELGLESKLMVIEILEYNGLNLEDTKFETRMQLLDAIIPDNARYIQVIGYTKNTQENYDKIVKDRGEGVVLVLKGAPYKRGKSSLWKKVKRTVTEEAILIGCMKGKGSRSSTFGSLMLAQVDKDGKLKYIGSTSGFDMREQNELYLKMLTNKAATIPDFVPRSVLGRVKFFVKPKIVVEVRYGNKTINNHARFPVFVRERIDKEPIECQVKQEMFILNHASILQQ